MRTFMDSPRTILHIRSIETLIVRILSSGSPKIIFKNWRHQDNLTFTNRVMLKTEVDMVQNQVNFDRDRSRPLFALILHFLAKIHHMLLFNIQYTKRELYYQEVQVVENQRTLEQVLLIICNLLECPPWELGIIATSKGLVAGPLLVKTNDSIIDCSSPGGTLIPHIVCLPNVELRSSAKYVLLIEKDATFQRLLNENVLDELSDSLIVTGKGFPDINTRMLINKLNKNLKLPILALVDADPFGIAIMCVYRFGSLVVLSIQPNMSSYSENLVTPAIRWLGVHPSDILMNNITSLPLARNDFVKLKFLFDRLFVQTHGKILEQLKMLLKYERKAEIEAICDYSPNYLTQLYNLEIGSVLK